MAISISLIKQPYTFTQPKLTSFCLLLFLYHLLLVQFFLCNTMCHPLLFVPLSLLCGSEKLPGVQTETTRPKLQVLLNQQQVPGQPPQCLHHQQGTPTYTHFLSITLQIYQWKMNDTPHLIIFFFLIQQDPDRLLQDVDINRLRAVVFRDVVHHFLLSLIIINMSLTFSTNKGLPHC